MTVKSLLSAALLAALALGTAPASAPAQSAAPSPEAMRCQALAAADFSALPDSPTTISSAQFVPAGGDLPAYCRVEGIVAPQVGFEVRLPVDSWNGKFLMQGCGGMCGSINMPGCEDALARHYAVTHTDMGHKGSASYARWGYNNRQAEIDFGYRATHVTAVAAKAIIARYYGKPHRYAYFRGCSTGGRQALVEAQRFPDDFDGIIAAAPVLDETGDAALHLLWSGRAGLGADGRPALTSAKIPAIRKAVLGACDGLDGFKDGIIQDPTQCRWSPRAIRCAGAETDACLTDAQIAAVDRLYDGATDSKGRKLWHGGMQRGSEHQWAPAFLAPEGKSALINAPGGMISDVLRYLTFFDDPGPSYDPATFDFDRDPPRMAMMEAFYTAMNPDLSAFKARGGKLLMFHGWDDLEVPPTLSIAYYDSMQARMGGRAATQSFARLFLLPGVAHCRRGPGPDAVDELSYLEAWVERGVAPDSVLAEHLKVEQSYLGLPRLRFPLAEGASDWSRPVYPYPMYAAFSGRGDPKAASSWTPKMSAIGARAAPR